MRDRPRIHRLAPRAKTTRVHLPVNTISRPKLLVNVAESPADRTSLDSLEEARAPRMTT